MANQPPRGNSGRSKKPPPYAVLLTKREAVAIVLALEEVHPRILGQLWKDAASAHKKLKAIAFSAG